MGGADDSGGSTARAYAQRRKDLPHLKRRWPSEYARDHVYWATQPMEEVEVCKFLRAYLEVMGFC